jgi:hypothetical protein
MGEERAIDVSDHFPGSIERRVPAMTMIGDLRRDWRRWSLVERACAAALTGLWAWGITTVMLVQAYLL